LFDPCDKVADGHGTWFLGGADHFSDLDGIISGAEFSFKGVHGISEALFIECASIYIGETTFVPFFLRFTTQQ
jgi:hypothetical protein